MSTRLLLLAALLSLTLARSPPSSKACSRPQLVRRVLCACHFHLNPKTRTSKLSPATTRLIARSATSCAAAFGAKHPDHAPLCSGRSPHAVLSVAALRGLAKDVRRCRKELPFEVARAVSAIRASALVYDASRYGRRWRRKPAPSNYVRRLRTGHKSRKEMRAALLAHYNGLPRKQE